LAAFVIAGMGTGLAGALMANYLRFVSPDIMHWTKSGELMMMVIVGGTATLIGPLLGAATMVLLEAFLASKTENWQLYLGFILLAIVMLTRGGLAAALDRLFGVERRRRCWNSAVCRSGSAVSPRRIMSVFRCPVDRCMR
jgi:branched-chain amino acid transport system permease protein